MTGTGTVQKWEGIDSLKRRQKSERRMYKTASENYRVAIQLVVSVWRTASGKKREITTGK
jgi:hypothetical protein